MLRLTLRPHPRIVPRGNSITVSLLCAALFGGSIVAQAAEPTVLLLPIEASGLGKDATGVASLENDIRARLKASGVRIVEPAAGESPASRDGGEIRRIADLTRADGAIDVHLSRSGRGLGLSVSLWDSSSATVSWRSFVEQADLAGIRALLPEMIQEAGAAAEKLEPRFRAAALAATPAPIGAPAPVAAPTLVIAPIGAPSQPSAPVSPLPRSSPTGAAPPDAGPAIGLPPEPRLVAPAARSYRAQLALRDFDACRFAGAAATAYALVDDSSLRLVVPSASSTDGLDEVGRLDSTPLETFVAVECIDVNGDGLDEVALTGRKNGGFRSRIYGVANGGAALSPMGQEVTAALRAASVGGGRRSLFAQRFPIPGRLYGRIQPAELKNGEVVLGAELALPEDANVGALAFGAATGMAGDATLTIDADARLRLMSQGRVIWSGPGHYGGYDVSYEVPDRLQSTASSLPRVYLRDRIESAEWNGAALLFVTEIEIPLGGVLPNLNVGRDVKVTAFRWNGQGLVSADPPFGYAPESIGDGALRDLRVTDVTGDHVPDLVLGVTDSEGGWLSFSSAASRIIVFPGAAPVPGH